MGIRPRCGKSLAGRMTEFWDLPGSSSFIRIVADDLRSGSNTVVTFPEHAPRDWLSALRRSLGDSMPRLEQFDPGENQPISAIHRYLELEPASVHSHVIDLCRNLAFQGRLLHFSPSSDAEWPKWRAFLALYEDVCKTFTLPQRTLFVAELRGPLSQEAPTPANLLHVHRWSGCLDSLDLRLYAAGLLSSSVSQHWQRNLSVTLLAELALWDPEVCLAGASRSLPELLEPADWLADLAKSRNWNPSDDTTLPSAEKRGIRHQFEGHSRIHSAWLALAGRSDALDYRIWNAQVASLFPLLERHRRSLIKTYARTKMLTVPWSTQFGEINRIEDLELNHIADQMARSSSGGLRDTYNFVCWLRDLRNDLAHLSAVRPERFAPSSIVARLERAICHDDL